MPRLKMPRFFKDLKEGYKESEDLIAGFILHPVINFLILLMPRL